MANNLLMYSAGRQGELTGGLLALMVSGKLKLYTGSQPAKDIAVTGTLLATMTFPNPAGTVTSGVFTAGTIVSDTNAAATGTAGYFAVTQSDNSTVLFTGTVGTSGCDLNIDNTTVNIGTTVSCSAGTVTAV